MTLLVFKARSLGSRIAWEFGEGLQYVGRDVALRSEAVERIHCVQSSRIDAKYAQKRFVRAHVKSSSSLPIETFTPQKTKVEIASFRAASLRSIFPNLRCQRFERVRSVRVRRNVKVLGSRSFRRNLDDSRVGRYPERDG